ncbi:MAG: DNA-processing protein DprA [Saccharofermentans sp.]|nr:DNA-processing protein DprA [Saccharofermentans sp.]
MDGNIFYYVWLTQIPGVGTITQRRLLDHFRSPLLIYESTPEVLFEVKGITKNQIEKIIENRNIDNSKRIIDVCQRQNIGCITLNSDCYPDKAAMDPNAPVLLYTKGDMHSIDMNKSVGIIGARRCTQEQKKYTADITTKYIEEGYTVISGMAKGVDSYSHTVCINNEGSTVAVLGNGLDICYPREHEFLMQAIADNGLLISEYPPGVGPYKYNFPRRNRIIAQWSDKLVVIGAGNRSGSLITADYANKIGREVTMVN